MASKRERTQRSNYVQRLMHYWLKERGIFARADHFYASIDEMIPFIRRHLDRPPGFILKDSSELRDDRVAYLTLDGLKATLRSALPPKVSAPKQQPQSPTGETVPQRVRKLIAPPSIPDVQQTATTPVDDRARLKEVLEEADCLIRQAQSQLRLQVRQDTDALIAECDASHIEEIFAAALSATCIIREGDYPRMMTDQEVGQLEIDHREIFTRVCPQAWIGNQRVDFLIKHRLAGKTFVKIIVECDGHDFHEKTKDQAARDKKRDRSFQMQGYKTFRFTGSEIYRDPFACAEEIAELIRIESTTFWARYRAEIEKEESDRARKVATALQLEENRRRAAEAEKKRQEQAKRDSKPDVIQFMSWNNGTKFTVSGVAARQWGAPPDWTPNEADKQMWEKVTAYAKQRGVSVEEPFAFEFDNADTIHELFGVKIVTRENPEVDAFNRRLAMHLKATYQAMGIPCTTPYDHEEKTNGNGAA